MKKLISLFLILSLLLCGCSFEIVVAPPEGTQSNHTPSDGSVLTVHFIDVGQADCALLECGGEFMIIDGGNRDDSQLVISYLESCGVEELKYVVCSHAHEDHVGGLPAVLSVYPTAHVLAPTKTYSSNVFDDFARYTDQQGLEITIPAPGDTFTLGEAEVTVLGPVTSYAETNDTSIILMVDFGSNRFLFTGDMEITAEADMLNYWEGRFDWNVDVLKVGHHGSSTSSSYRFVYETDPEYAIISCGEDNSYGHPHREIVRLYNDAGVPMFRTDELGTILAVCDGTDITITWEKSENEPADVEAAQLQYVGNKNSGKFHSSTCTGLPKEENRIYFDSYQQAIDAGYTPCSSCLN